jgi:hypothetical protein
MADKPLNLTTVLGSDAMQEYLDAQKNAREKYEERNNRLFDPTMLAMAQGFLAPTKSGSFGESLGNVAAAVGPAQSAEEKRIMEMAKMRLDMAQQGLSTEIQTKKAQQSADLMKNIMNGGAPDAVPAPQIAPEAPKPLAQPTGGGLPAVAPPPASPLSAPPQAAPQAAPVQASAPALPSAPPVAPAQPPQPAGVQLFPAQQRGYSDQEKMMALSMQSAGKEPYEIMQAIDEFRRKGLQSEKGQTTDLRTGRIYTDFDPTPTETYIDGFGNLKIPASQAKMYGRERDPAKRAALAKEIIYGLQNPPSQPNATPTGAAPANAPAQTATEQKPRLTVEQEAAAAAALKAEKEADAKERSKRTGLAIDKLDPAIEVRAVAETAKNLVNQEGGNLVVGIFEKPKIGSILGKMVDEGKFTPAGFRDAMVAANVAFTVDQRPDETSQEYTDRKQAILDRYYQMGTQVARAKFEASTLAKGQGAFSDGERRMFADTTISTKMSVSSMNKTADMLIARANFAESVAEKLLGKEMSYDKFRITPEYKSMLKAYEARLQSIWSGNTRAPSGGGRPDINAAGANLERQGI